MSDVKIPTKFRLAGRTWTVQRGWRSRKSYGDCDNSKCLIRISSTKCKTYEDELHAFYHELLHAVAATMGWTKLNEDETTIDGMASLLMQVAISAEYAED